MREGVHVHICVFWGQSARSVRPLVRRLRGHAPPSFPPWRSWRGLRSTHLFGPHSRKAGKAGRGASSPASVDHRSWSRIFTGHKVVWEGTDLGLGPIRQGSHTTVSAPTTQEGLPFVVKVPGPDG